MPDITNQQLAEHVLPDSLVNAHREGDLAHFEKECRAAVAELATCSDAEFHDMSKRVLMLLAFHDHLTDRRTIVMLSDYFNW